MMMSIGIIAMSVGPLQESELMMCHLDADACLPCSILVAMAVIVKLARGFQTLLLCVREGFRRGVNGGREGSTDNQHGSGWRYCIRRFSRQVEYYRSSEGVLLSLECSKAIKSMNFRVSPL